eukprot:Plantae.Rhodophyta-Hildenbrandia_rubra.ctg715.p1 GENE.Plantae.Rhodophyta-Hildenbrandia_rubra.ctg715~~Plantae.Rhodophyta-Hildenbrandia_rubra.ctg715.p1  ORF type:complete len:136 (-),score=19.16 Plantae.Rhodophyta-Hildenbrandia_rubra.ctg715:285-635(-)
MLHAMRNRAWHSEAEAITSRSLPKLAELADCMRANAHGAPNQICFDSEFNKSAFLEHLEAKGIDPNVAPPRRHNKLRVERKNRALKLLTRKLRSAHPDRPLRWSVKDANFLGSVLY